MEENNQIINQVKNVLTPPNWTSEELNQRYVNILKNKLNITEDISSERALEIIDKVLDNVSLAKSSISWNEGHLERFEETVADFENGRVKEGTYGENGVDYFRQRVKEIKEKIKSAKEELEKLPKQEELEELRKLYNAQVDDLFKYLPLETVDLSDSKNRNTVRYHNSKDATIIYDISGMGDDIKIEDSVGHSGTWASKQEHGIESISNWIEYNPEILEYDKQNPRKLSGYITEFKYKEDANILYIHNSDTLKRVLNKYGDGRDKISWNKVASDFDAVRIDSNPLGFSKYQMKVLDYYGDTDVIFNPDIFETINTYNADEYFREDKKPIFTADNSDKIITDESTKLTDKIEKLESEIEQTDKINFDEILEDAAKETKKQEIKKAKQEIKKAKKAKKEITKQKIKNTKKVIAEEKVVAEHEIKNTEKVITESKAINTANKLENKTIQNTAKESLNTKNLGLFAIGTAAVLGTVGLIAHEKNKKKNKQNKVHYNEKRQEELSDIDYNNDLQYANQITNFSKGHSTYSLG